MRFLMERHDDYEDYTRPGDIEVEKTNVVVGILGTAFTRRGAEKLRARNVPRHPGLRYEVEQDGLFRWTVVGYQNLPKQT